MSVLERYKKPLASLTAAASLAGGLAVKSAEAQTKAPAAIEEVASPQTAESNPTNDKAVRIAQKYMHHTVLNSCIVLQRVAHREPLGFQQLPERDYDGFNNDLNTDEHAIAYACNYGLMKIKGDTYAVSVDHEGVWGFFDLTRFKNDPGFHMFKFAGKTPRVYAFPEDYPNFVGVSDRPVTIAAIEGGVINPSTQLNQKLKLTKTIPHL
jgi:hypothetical protein